MSTHTNRAAPQDAPPKVIGAGSSGPTAPNNDNAGELYGFGMGPIVFAGTAAMIADILKILELDAKISEEYNEIVGTGIQTSMNGAQNAATATSNSLLQQAKQSGNNEMSAAVGAAGSFLSGGAMLGTLGVGHSAMSTADDELMQGNTIKDTSNEIMAKPPTEDHTVTDASDSDTTPVTEKKLSAGEQAQLDALKEGNFGPLKGATKQQITRLLNVGYSDAEGDLADSGNTFLNKVAKNAQSQIESANAAKNTVQSQRQIWQQIGSSAGQFISQTAQATAQAENANNQTNEAGYQATQVINQAVLSAGQTIQSEALQGRDAQIQQITALIQMLQGAQSANQFRG
ncbi:MAG: hypothetical protein HY860_06065 [Chlamydiales bacterium]|nr:hypothetical protein [Chlamydiales bacterium]